MVSGQAVAQTAADAPPQTEATVPAETPPVRLRTTVPDGFQDIDAPLSTQFDLIFQGQPIGSFAGTYQNGQFTFQDPATVALALGDGVDVEAARAFLSQPQAANEQFRCRPGQAAAPGCGTLPSNLSGVIVDIDSFTVSVFLPREALISRVILPRELGEPYAGFSLIQNVQMSAATIGGIGGVSYGGTFTTLASVGRNAIIARTTLTDVSGFRSEELYAQRLWGERRAAVGLLQDYQTLTLNNYRMVGAEFGSFFGTLVDPANDTATPIEVLLPRRAQVEIYRYGVLVSSGVYEAGLQLIDTRPLPDGTYSVQVIARDGAQILLDQTRTFSRLTNSVPLGKFGFRVRAGERVEDNIFGNILTGEFGETGGGFLPSRTGELILSGSLQRRFTTAIGGNVTVSSFDSRLYGESSLEITRGRLSGVVGVGAGSGGAHSAVISGSVQFNRVSVFLTARRTRVDDEPFDLARRDRRYRPFFSDQDTVFGSVQTQVFGGAFSLTGSYTAADDLPDRYTAAAQFTRSMRLPLVGSALLTAGVARSNFDTRIGFSVSFFQRIDRKTNASFNVGAQHLSSTEQGGGRSGFSPIVDARVTRYEQVGGVDLVGEVGASTDADADRAAARILAASRYGSGDISAQWQSRSFGGNNFSFQSNVETGFAIGGGAVKFGLRNPAEAMVLLDLTKAPVVRAAPVRSIDSTAEPVVVGDGTATPLADGSTPAIADRVAEGGYRVTIDGRPYDYVGPGTRTAIGVPPLREYVVGLKPEGAPEFDLDATQRKVTLFPGNVARVRFEAQRVITLFGQIVSDAGAPVAAARIEAEKDVAVADDRGFFTITAPASGDFTVRLPNGALCTRRVITSLTDVNQPVLVHRIGAVRCEAQVSKIEALETGSFAQAATGSALPMRSSSAVEMLSKARRDIELIGVPLARE